MTGTDRIYAEVADRMARWLAEEAARDANRHADALAIERVWTRAGFHIRHVDDLLAPEVVASGARGFVCALLPGHRAGAGPAWRAATLRQLADRLEARGQAWAIDALWCALIVECREP